MLMEMKMATTRIDMPLLLMRHAEAMKFEMLHMTVESLLGRGGKHGCCGEKTGVSSFSFFSACLLACPAQWGRGFGVVW